MKNTGFQGKKLVEVVDIWEKMIRDKNTTILHAIQITTDSPQWGGLSGRTFDEAVSWGKETKIGQYAQCYCDATIGLPIVAHALADRGKKRKGHELGKTF